MGKNKSSNSKNGRTNLATATSALMSVLYPDRLPSSSEPQPSTSCVQHESWQQSLQDLEADERLARQLAEEEQIALELSRASGSRHNPTLSQSTIDADEKLARQLAQEEEDMYFGPLNRHTHSQQQFHQQRDAMSTNNRKEKRIDVNKEFNPINFSNVVIHTKSSKKAAKQLARKQHFTTVTVTNNTDTSDALSAARKLRSVPEVKYPHVYDALLDAKFSLASLNNKKVYLPSTSTRQSFSDYEEITVKKMEKTSLVPEDKLVSVADNLDEIGKVAFAGCSHLNPMQSIVFETAYKKNKNMLVAAPTGAGKTNVAMLAVLNELRNYFTPGTTEMIEPNISEKFKIIYIAPMKSLAVEQTENFSSRLRSLGIRTRELTGDMSLTEREMSQTHIIVTTPEKWDVVTRKAKGDVELLSLVRLLIIDEVHLLQSDRGPVLEALVARTLRYVESSQRMTRIIGLSATLPNYIDVATFLRVDPYDGLFYFDNRFRPVPLTQTFVGVRPLDSNNQSKCMDKICLNLILQYVLQSKQVMIFVHARNSTQRVAMKLREMIQLKNKIELFQPDLIQFPEAAKMINSAKDKMLTDLFNIGFGIHHAGMIRHDRCLVENLFRSGVLKVLVCTATLAWGVNFPAHAVIIRGTDIYDASVGKFVDVGLLDVMQIFGRAGRPQYDSDGHAIILTGLDKLDSYLKLLTNQTPIESNFVKHLTDNLNAEIASGTVTSVQEAMEWLKYTYLHVRLAQNPLVYGCDHFEIESDPTLATIRSRLVINAARQLDEAQMCRYNQESGELEVTDLGRIASHFYINYETITRYNELIKDNMEMQDLLGLIGEAQEFQQIKYREEESSELEKLKKACHLPIAGGALETTKGKVSCLLQAYISKSFIDSHSLISDLMYIAQNATRIGRGLFEYSLKRCWPITTLNSLKMCKMLEQQTWDFQSPFRHFDFPFQVINKLEESRITIEELEEMTANDIGHLVCYPDKMGTAIRKHIRYFPYVIVEGNVKPIKSNLLFMELTVQPFFEWNDRFHGKMRQNFWLWVVDEEITQQIYYSERIKFSKEQVEKDQSRKVVVNIPLINDTLEDGSIGQRVPSEFIVFVLSDEWIGCDYEFPIECRKITLPEEEVAYTKVPLNLNQLPLRALRNDLYASIFSSSDQAFMSSSSRFSEVSSIMNLSNFNTIQSQVFHQVYNCDKSLLVCGPPGSGKTLLADLAALRVFSAKNRTQARHKIFYITPLESLAHRKFRDWRERMGQNLRKQVAILNDYNLFDKNLFNQCDIAVASAEKFYLWLSRSESIEDLLRVSLVIVDDLHLLSDHRGCHLELVIARLNILKSTDNRIHFRYLGISNTVSNAQDLAGWLGIKRFAAYNFESSTTRPIQLETHIISFPERRYSPRMTSMNKPIFKAMMKHNPDDPTLIFVASKKQCNLTALDLISCLAHYSSHSEKRWLHIEQTALESLLTRVQHDDLKFALEFGIGILYPSMQLSDRKTVEELFQYQKIQVLICTTNYAWDSSFRARLVVVKGTEHYDTELERFVDFPPADVMQMLGCAGRPNLDSTGIALLMLRDTYKEFYKKFLYEPFPVESNLMRMDEVVLRNYLLPEKPITDIPPVEIKDLDGFGLDDGIKPEIVSRSKAERKAELLECKKYAMERLSQSFLARRIERNPSYYGINDATRTEVFLSRFLDRSKFLYKG